MRQTSLFFLTLFLPIFVGSFIILYHVTSIPIENFFGLMSVICYVLTLVPSLTRIIIPQLKRQKGIIWLSKYRRYTGVAAFCFATDHSILILIQHQANMLDWHTYSQYFQGLLMLGILTLLTATSNHESVRYLRHHWKTIHQLTYLVPVLLLWHLVTKMTAWTWATPIAIVLAVVTIVLLLIRLFLEQRFLRKRQSLL